MNLQDMKCVCGKLLAKINIENGTVERKCPSCKRIITITIKPPEDHSKPYQERITGHSTK